MSAASASQARPPNGRDGFTLIELMLVVLLMALMTSAAALSFSGPLRRARAHDAVEQLRSFDATTRIFAQRYGRFQRIAFDVPGNTLCRRESQRDDRTAYQINLPSGYWVEEVRIGQRTVSDDEAAIDFSPQGTSRSYALLLRGPQSERWIVFAGLTGEMVQANDESTMAQLLAKSAIPA